jgi:hypothetical protein
MRRLDTVDHSMSETFSPHVSAKSASITSPQPLSSHRPSNTIAIILLAYLILLNGRSMNFGNLKQGNFEQLYSVFRARGVVFILGK